MSILTVPVAELSTRLSELLAKAASGTVVFVTDGVATGQLVSPPNPPPATPAKREWVFNMHPGAMIMRDDFDAYIDDDDFLRGDI